MLRSVTGVLGASSLGMLDPSYGLTQHPLHRWHRGSCVMPERSLGVAELLQKGSEDFYHFCNVITAIKGNS